VYYLTYHEDDDLSGAKPEDMPGPLPAFSGYNEVIRAYEQRDRERAAERREKIEAVRPAQGE